MLASSMKFHELATVVYCALQQAQAKRIVPCDWIIDTANETARYTIKKSIYRFHQSQLLLQKRKQYGGIKGRYSKLLLAQLSRLIRLEF